MKSKIALILAILSVVLPLVGITVVLTGIVSDFKGSDVVENYCSTAYSNNVQEYKSCKQLSTIELLEKLTKDAEKKNSIPELAPLKF